MPPRRSRRRPWWNRLSYVLQLPILMVLHVFGFVIYQIRSGRSLRFVRRTLRFLLMPVYYLLSFLQFLTWKLGEFAFDWGRTRSFSAFFLGIPATAVGGAAAFVLVAGIWQARGELVTNYTRAAAKALEAEDLDRAELYGRKLSYLDQADPAVQFGIGMLALEKEKPARAQQIMERLAPRDRAGFVPAHLWLAKWYLKHTAPDDTRRREWAVAHLERAVSEEPKNLEANLLLGQLRLSEGDFDGADELLNSAARQRPEIGASIARLWYKQGDAERGRQYVLDAKDQLIRQVELKPEDLVARSQLADAHALLGEFSEAERVLLGGQPAANTDELRSKLRESLGALYAMWANSVRRQQADPARLATCLKLMERAVEYAPSHPAVMLVLRECAFVEGEEGAQFDELLEQMLARGEAPALVHLIIGTKAVSSEDLSKAVLHLEQAYRLEPDSAMVLANLAWTLANTSPPQYERALELANAALKKLEDHPELYETRGFVLLRLGRANEAVPDLERALTKIKGRSRLHEMLSEAYDALGETTLADRHRQLAIDAKSNES